MIRPDPEKAAAWRPAPRIVRYGARDAVLYALGLGLGADPLDRDELAFVYEAWGPKVLPTFVCALGHDFRGFQDGGAGLGDAPNVHGDETVEIHRPLAAEGELECRSRIAGLYDRGEGGHAILKVEDEAVDAATGESVATLRQTAVLVGAGGFGGEPPPPSRRVAMPDRAPDAVAERTVIGQAALLYRLSGDLYALHADPDFARAAGFDGPILHGLATYGIACHAVVAACCDRDPAGVRAFHGRFVSPVYPGDTLATEIWREGATAFHRTRCLERDAVVLDDGRAELRE